jgi:eukaryotic-like serine/threonine-protein kinase
MASAGSDRASPSQVRWPRFWEGEAPAEPRSPLPARTEPRPPEITRDRSCIPRRLRRRPRWPEAERTARECLSRPENKQRDDWWCYQTTSQLGVALAGQKKYAEAEPLILAGSEGLKAREDQIPAPAKGRLTEAGERVVQLYENMGKPEQAALWRTKLGMVSLPADVFAPP